MLAVFHYSEGQKSTLAIVAPFLPLLGHTELTCQKYVRSSHFQSIATEDIFSDASFIHCRGRGCIFLENSGVRQIEREQSVVEGRLLFQHDFNNEVYLLNRFCFNH